MVVARLSGIVETLGCFLVVFSVVVDPAQGAHGARVVVVAHFPGLFVVLCFVFVDISQHAQQTRVFAVFLHQFVKHLQGFLLV